MPNNTLRTRFSDLSLARSSSPYRETSNVYDGSNLCAGEFAALFVLVVGLFTFPYSFECGKLEC